MIDYLSDSEIVRVSEKPGDIENSLISPSLFILITYIISRQLENDLRLLFVIVAYFYN